MDIKVQKARKTIWKSFVGFESLQCFACMSQLMAAEMNRRIKLPKVKNKLIPDNAG